MIIEAGTVFKILNLCMVSCAVFYVVRRYGLAYIRSAMKLETVGHDELSKLYKSLQNDNAKIVGETKEQDKLYEQMKQRFEAWQQDIQQQDKDKQDQLEKHLLVLKEKNKQKQQALEQRILFKNQMPLLIQESENELQSDLNKDSGKRKEYVSKLISALEK